VIYNKPRKMMSVERMRKQREKHHPTRYQVWYFDRRLFVNLYPEWRDFLMADLEERFMVDVRRWNFSRKALLSAMTVEETYDIDFDRVKIVFEVRRLPKWTVVPPPRTLTQIVDEFCTSYISAIASPNELRRMLGYSDPL
jgi:hypothetical protein